jgi:hypothetical protein
LILTLKEQQEEMTLKIWLNFIQNTSNDFHILKQDEILHLKKNTIFPPC